jgi:N-acetylated-alpha-linked acidic dipeptidase
VRDSIEEQNRQLEESTYVAMNDPRRPTVSPEREEVPPFLDLAPLQNGVARLKSATARFETAYAILAKADTSPDPAMVDGLNALLRRAERALAPQAGLPRRSWYRQLLSAPGRYTGYSPKTFPGAREAIEGKRWAEADSQAAVLGRALASEAAVLDSASTLVEEATRASP